MRRLVVLVVASLLALASGCRLFGPRQVVCCPPQYSSPYTPAVQYAPTANPCVPSAAPPPPNNCAPGTVYGPSAPAAVPAGR